MGVMGEVRYSVNGKYFKDYSVLVSDSDGLFDALKRKSVNSYDWAEYHGESPDLSNPKFEPREISLKGFVVGDNWVLMKSNFDSIIAEFQKAGTQRLLIEPFNMKALPFEVYMSDNVKLDKRFKDGKMVGTFSMKMIEPNPIKKVLYFVGKTLELSYASPSETEIFYGNGAKDTAKGDVSISGKVVADKYVSNYDFQGRNLMPHSYFKYYPLEWPVNGGAITKVSEGLQLDISGIGQGVFRTLPALKSGETYTISIWTKAVYQEGLPQINIGISNGTSQTVALPTNGEEFIKTTVTVIANAAGGAITIYGGNTSISRFILQKIKVEKGSIATPYSAIPYEERYIIIAGNMDEITGLTTNAEVLWERL